MTGWLTVRDVFGLTRAQIRAPERRRLLVRPGLLGDQSTPPVETSAGYDTTQRAKTSDEEQYFMRENVPGDRMKDINWKATSRLGELITRISPLTQEQTQLLHVVLRRYRRRGGETMTALLHLDFVKSWLLTFLRVVKQQHPEFTFLVDTGGESHQTGGRCPAWRAFRRESGSNVRNASSNHSRSHNRHREMPAPWSTAPAWWR